MKVFASFVLVDIPHYTLYLALSSGERVVTFERVLEVPPGEADKLLYRGKFLYGANFRTFHMHVLHAKIKTTKI